ncbi:hypothetical protein [Micromonospora peucetia]|uniref:RHIM domain-containing protein n=1 Tax=Micromonospora peucetia TaxID=47871 RepID=A0ABZ1ED19_9ACTN|nr:hypothetical protein [Micromonospora peucetia]WSA31520.1 hypothetical protein OIE14_25850 [Micromonospora peucetia]
MDEINVIVGALAAGASAGVSGTATEAVKDSYQLLKTSLQRRFTGRAAALEQLAADETEPGVWQARIGQDLHDSGAVADQQILTAARELLALADPARAAQLNITVDTVNGAVGSFHAPVSFDQRTQLPPAPPAAG